MSHIDENSKLTNEHKNDNLEITEEQNNNPINREIKLEEFSEYFEKAKDYLNNNGRASVLCENGTVIFEKNARGIEDWLEKVNKMLDEGGWITISPSGNIMVSKRESARDYLFKEIRKNYEKNAMAYENEEGDILFYTPYDSYFRRKSPLEIARENYRDGGIAYINSSSEDIVFASRKMGEVYKRGICSDFQRSFDKFFDEIRDIVSDLQLNATKKTDTSDNTNSSPIGHMEDEVSKLYGDIMDGDKFIVLPDGSLEGVDSDFVGNDITISPDLFA